MNALLGGSAATRSSVRGAHEADISMTKREEKPTDSKRSQKDIWLAIRGAAIDGASSVDGLSSEDREDIASDVVAKLLDITNDRGTRPDNLDGYAYKAGRNAALDRSKKVRREKLSKVTLPDSDESPFVSGRRSRPKTRLTPIQLRELGRLRKHLCWQTRDNIVASGIIFREPESEKLWYEYICDRVGQFVESQGLSNKSPADFIEKLTSFRESHASGLDEVSRETLDTRLITRGRRHVTLSEYEKRYCSPGIVSEANGQVLEPMVAYQLSEHAPLTQLADRIVDRSFQLWGFTGEECGWLSARESSKERKLFKKAVDLLTQSEHRGEHTTATRNTAFRAKKHK